jgi:hypothetical protein
MAIPRISPRKTLPLFAALALALAWAFAAPAFADGDDVVALTESTFEKEVGQDRGALVEFYAPWFVLVPFVSPDPCVIRLDRVGSDRIRVWVVNSDAGCEVWGSLRFCGV